MPSISGLCLNCEKLLSFDARLWIVYITNHLKIIIIIIIKAGKYLHSSPGNLGASPGRADTQDDVRGKRTFAQEVLLWVGQDEM